jgi:hypothetical protein
MLMCLGLWSCQKDDPTAIDYVIFGDIYGKCFGECRTVYLVNEDGVFAENKGLNQFEDFSFDNDDLSKDKFKLAKTCLEIPKCLVENNIKTDAIIYDTEDYTWYIETKTNGIKSMIFFDKIDPDKDSELFDYVELVQSIHKKIQ